MKSLGRTIAAHKALKKNPDLLSLHTDLYLGKGGPGLVISHEAQSSSSATGALVVQSAQWFVVLHRRCVCGGV